MNIQSDGKTLQKSKSHTTLATQNAFANVGSKHMEFLGLQRQVPAYSDYKLQILVLDRTGPRVPALEHRPSQANGSQVVPDPSDLLVSRLDLLLPARSCVR